MGAMGSTGQPAGDDQAGPRTRARDDAGGAGTADLLDAIATATHDRARSRNAPAGRAGRGGRGHGGRHRSCGERPVGLFVVEVDRVDPVAGAPDATPGDVLATLVGRLADTVRDRDLVFRLDGAVAVLCPGVDDPDTAHAIATRLREAADGTSSHGGGLVHLSTRVGGALLRGSHLPVDPSTLVRQAFAALDELHDDRGRCVLLHDVGPGPDGPALDLASDLRRAVGTGQLRLVWHPLVAADGAAPHFEALLRWRHPVLGALPPGRFIPLAELHGQIGPLGDWALREACRRARTELVPAGAGAVGVNVSPRQLTDDWPDRVASALEDTGLDATQLTVELTETVAVPDVAHAARVLARVRELGVDVAIDDYGTGQCSLSRLCDLPVDVVKLDRSFVDRVHLDDRCRTLVGGLTATCHALDICVVAEGVETRDQLEALRAVGVDRTQGYVWTAPLESDEVPAWLTRHAAGR